MHFIKITLLAVICSLAVSACSMFGNESVNVAPYQTLEKDGDFEVRTYERLILVSTTMPEGLDSEYGPFRKLFDYISGNNEKSEEIAMTAPVFLDQSAQATETMSFVLPADFDLATAPLPKDSAVELTERRNYKVAVISFSGFLNQDNISMHRAELQEWIAGRGFKVVGEPKAAGYNGPFTLPFLRHNEVLIPIENL